MNWLPKLSMIAFVPLGFLRAQAASPDVVKAVLNFPIVAELEDIEKVVDLRNPSCADCQEIMIIGSRKTEPAYIKLQVVSTIDKELKITIVDNF